LSKLNIFYSFVNLNFALSAFILSFELKVVEKYFYPEMIINFYKIYIVVIAASALLLVQSCDDTLTSTEVNNIVMPDSNVSYAQHIAPVFEVKCVPCHNNTGRKEAGLDLSSWNGITADPSIVARGSDSTSILVWTIEGYPNYPLMPPTGRMIDNHINGIRTWIKEGALNN
jgi:hypothetical protein